MHDWIWVLTLSSGRLEGGRRIEGGGIVEVQRTADGGADFLFFLWEIKSAGRRRSVRTASRGRRGAKVSGFGLCGRVSETGSTVNACGIGWRVNYGRLILVLIVIFGGSDRIILFIVVTRRSLVRFVMTGGRVGVRHVFLESSFLVA